MGKHIFVCPFYRSMKPLPFTEHYAKHSPTVLFINVYRVNPWAATAE